MLPSVVTTTGEEENQSITLGEAQASGLSVIATRIGGTAEGMRHGETGLLVPPRDPGALAAAIAWMIEHPEALGVMGSAGRRLVEEQFNLSRLNDQLVEVYGMMCRQRI
jgi:colanic acid/amylovoran biosynthesis glycosyltransferase